MKLHQILKGLVTLTVFVLVSAMAMAQTPTERAANGNAPSASSSARIDMTNESVRRFVSTQEALVTGIQTTVNTTNTSILARLGQMRDTLINFTPVAGCDPELGPHGCACACSGPNQKLLWNGTRWQCYESQEICPSVPQGQRPLRFNPETCRCEVCETCPLVGVCEPEDEQVVVPTGGLNGCGQPAGTCVCRENLRRPQPGFPNIEAHLQANRPLFFGDSLAPYISSYRVTESGCPTNMQCVGGMNYSGRPGSCCCPAGQAWLGGPEGRCGDICPSGYTPYVLRTHVGVIFSGCNIPQYFPAPATGDCQSPYNARGCEAAPAGMDCSRGFVCALINQNAPQQAPFTEYGQNGRQCTNREPGPQGLDGMTQ